MTWFIITQKKWIIYICILNRLHLQFVTKTMPWTNYFWNALLLTLLHSCILVYYTSTITKTSIMTHHMTMLHNSTCPLAYLLIPFNLLSFAYSFIPSLCYHLLAHSHSHTLSCIHLLTHVFIPSVVHLSSHSLVHLTYYLCIPLKAFSFSHLLTPS